MRIFQTKLSVTVLLGIVAVAGCMSTKTTDSVSDSSPDTKAVAVATNANCPIMGGKVTDEGGRTEWDGMTVGFCCPDCVDDWNKLSDDDKATKLAEADADASDEQEHTAHTSAEE